jgi:hypothetical protein
LDLSREEAKGLCQILISQSYIVPYRDSSIPFQDSDKALYLFTVIIFDFEIEIENEYNRIPFSWMLYNLLLRTNQIKKKKNQA